MPREVIFPLTVILPSVKKTYSNILISVFHPAFLMAGVMNLVQISLSESSFFKGIILIAIVKQKDNFRNNWDS